MTARGCLGIKVSRNEHVVSCVESDCTQQAEVAIDIDIGSNIVGNTLEMGVCLSVCVWWEGVSVDDRDHY